MIANGIIDKDLKILISSSCNNDAVQIDNIDFVTSGDESYPIAPLKVPAQNQINLPVIENTPIISIIRKTQCPYRFR